ncbi:MAG: hypothetical protein DRP86_04035, partial [Candidatus Neomarinimicrobiota bacterium]
MKNQLIKMGPLHIVTDESPLLFGAIYLGESNVLLCEKGIQSILVRTYNAVSEPVLLTECSILHKDTSKIQYLLTDKSKKFSCKLDCRFAETGLHYQAEYNAPEPIWLTEWSLSGLDFDKVIVPALGGQVISDQMPEETTLSYKYPFWLNAQFVMGIKVYGGLYVHSRDTSADLKLLRIRREKGRFTLTYGFEAPARKKSTRFVTEWFVDGFEDDWRIPAADYRKWMADAFHAQSLKHQTSIPDWARKINFILELWGARRESPIPHHSYNQMIRRLKDFQKIHSPEETLVYLPGFAEHGIDSHIPDYNPSPLLGGEEGFRKLVDTAHD